MKHILEELTKTLGIKSAVEHMFATLGNGIDLDNKGYIRGNYRSQEDFELPDPEPLKSIYPWNDTERFQPFRDLAGCRDKGFREVAEYFIACIELTPDTVDRIKPWKENIETVKEVLLETPTIEDEYTDPNDLDTFMKSLSGKTTGCRKHTKSKTKVDDSLKSVHFFDVQWSDCPEEVEKEVIELWADLELGNDHYISKQTLDQELFDDYPKIYLWLKHKGVKEDEKVIIHWWW